MKFILVFYLFSAVAALQTSPQENECQDQVGASDKEVEMFQTMRQPKERSTKCYYDCIMQRLNYSDGKRFNRDGFLHTMMPQVKNEKYRQTVLHLAEKCDGTENDDPCELAADIVACLYM